MKIGIIFDMDGTIWDSASNVAASWNEVFRSRGISNLELTEEDLKSVMGMTMNALADRLLSSVPVEERYRLMDACGVYENDYLREHGGIVYPEVEETLRTLKERGYHLFIVSNCQSGYIEAFLDHYGLWYLFDDIECYGNNNQGKDVNVRAIAERNHLDHWYYVGDIQGDYDSSTAGGAEFIHAAYGFGTVKQDVKRIHAFRELADLFGAK